MNIRDMMDLSDKDFHRREKIANRLYEELELLDSYCDDTGHGLNVSHVAARARQTADYGDYAACEKMLATIKRWMPS